MVCHPFPQPSLAFHPQAQLCPIPSAPTCHMAAQCQDPTVKGHIRFPPSPLGLLHARQAPPSDCPVQGLRTEVCAQSVFLTKKTPPSCLWCVSVLPLSPVPSLCPASCGSSGCPWAGSLAWPPTPSRSSLCPSGPAPDRETLWRPKPNHSLH